MKLWKYSFTNNEIKYDVSTYFGHTSRIWDCILMEKKGLICSVSEDATCRVFDLKTRDCLKVIKGHQGKNIRSIEQYEDFIFTGGEDAQVFKWDIETILKNEQINVNI